jgi:cytochrome P450
VESAVLDELGRVLEGRIPRVEDIPRLRYTRMVLGESMRLYPPTWIFVRMAMEDDRLSSGIAIARGSKAVSLPICDAPASPILSGT